MAISEDIKIIYMYVFSKLMLASGAGLAIGISAGRVITSLMQ